MRSQVTDENRKPLSTGAKATATMARTLMSSSPPRTQSQKGKEKRDPSITPRRFGRFFTPRARVSGRPTSASSRALRDLTSSALNRCQTPSSPLRPSSSHTAQNPDDVFAPTPARPNKRQKRRHISDTPLGPLSPPASSPSLPNMQASPIRGRQLLSPIRDLPAGQFSQMEIDSDDTMSEDELPEMLMAPVKRLTTIPSRGMAAQLLTRMTGGAPRAGHQLMRTPVADWRTETADFYSRPQDVHTCLSKQRQGSCIPFSVASCNTNSLVAIGDEEGYISLLDSNSHFSHVHMAFEAHGNAIIDLTFSDDDKYIATAAGDQLGKVITMETQQTLSTLNHHTASLKQIRFQPGQNNNHILATSSRDGSIQFWDTRCTHSRGPAQEIFQRATGLQYARPRTLNAAGITNSVFDAHGRPFQHHYQTRQNPHPLVGSSPVASSDIVTRNEVAGRIGDVSVTAIQFLPQGQEHLILSASEADSTIKLWDMRYTQYSSKSVRNSYPIPVSQTLQPDSHLAFRPFGISALALSGDGNRLYSLCKDNTVYAYSTPHLITGHASELDPHAHFEPPRKGRMQAHAGLGPLYGFRHPSFHATSFYIKAAIRPAREGKCEMLAVGSMDNCPVLFPTDERYFRRDLGAGREFAPPHGVDDRMTTPIINLGGGGGGGSSIFSHTRPTMSRTNSIIGGGGGLSGRMNDTIPVYKEYGTALVRGHDKEVGPLTWTRDGKLVTVGDDYTVRCWAEDREAASDLRTGGEVNGRRWRRGWADVGEKWEGDGEEDEF